MVNFAVNKGQICQKRGLLTAKLTICSSPLY